MKDGLENIDEIFKQAFEGFEANVDPSVWTNVQNAIAGGTGAADTTPKIDPSTVNTVVTKSIITKIAIGVALVGALGTAGYYIAINDNNSKITKENKIAENTVEPITNEVIEKAKPLVVEADKQEKIEAKEQKVVVKDDLSSESEVVNTTEASTEVESNSETEKTVKKETDIVSSNNTIKLQDDSQVKESESSTSKEEDEVETLEKVKEKAQPEEETTTTPQPKPEKKEAVVDQIPNAISPNGDGLNDKLKITGENLEKIELVIMDKTGKPLYRITSLDDEWTGKDQAGFDLIPGVYYMAGIVVDSDGNSKKIKQAINLFK